jgi:hypothetical protein
LSPETMGLLLAAPAVAVQQQVSASIPLNGARNIIFYVLFGYIYFLKDVLKCHRPRLLSHRLSILHYKTWLRMSYMYTSHSANSIKAIIYGGGGSDSDPCSSGPRQGWATMLTGGICTNPRMTIPNMTIPRTVHYQTVPYLEWTIIMY